MDLLPILPTLTARSGAILLSGRDCDNVCDNTYIKLWHIGTRCSQKLETKHYEFNLNPRGLCLQRNGSMILQYQNIHYFDSDGNLPLSLCC